MGDQRRLGVVLFPRFELLDVFGPLEAFGMLPDRFELLMVAAARGAVPSAQGPGAVADFGFNECPPLDLVLVPGGIGTRAEVKNEALLDFLKRSADHATRVISVCTGSALLARAGLLDGKRATSNKRAFKWVVEQGPAVNWVKQARWVEDGKFITSAGVSAGIDMALAIIARLEGRETADKVAAAMEYRWHDDPADDPFAKLNGLV